MCYKITFQISNWNVHFHIKSEREKTHYMPKKKVVYWSNCTLHHHHKQELRGLTSQYFFPIVYFKVRWSWQRMCTPDASKLSQFHYFLLRLKWKNIDFSVCKPSTTESISFTFQFHIHVILIKKKQLENILGKHTTLYLENMYYIGADI